MAARGIYIPRRDHVFHTAGYETVRYPLSGLVGTDADRAATHDHNAGFPNFAGNVKTLDANIMAWLTLPVYSGHKSRGLVVSQFAACMNAPNYTLFSNKTSMDAWNAANSDKPVVALESPHNFIHLAVGGFDIPAYNASPIAGGDGDMGENDTAALDPIFYFHHCFIDVLLGGLHGRPDGGGAGPRRRELCVTFAQQGSRSNRMGSRVGPTKCVDVACRTPRFAP